MAIVSNPYYAEVLFTVGDFDLTPIPPQYLKQFSYERTTNSSNGNANKFTLEIFDSPGLELEYKLSQGLDNCKFQYGYSNGKYSKVYSGKITYYDTDFVPGGVIISVEGISTGLASLGKPISKAYSNGLISDYVLQVAEEEGWKVGYIEETSPVSDGELDNKTYRRNNTDAITFITNTLVPEAKSASSGESGYILYFEDLDDGTHVYFCTPNWKNESSKSTGSSSPSNSNKSSLFNYEFQVGFMQDSEVISFNPEYSGLLTAVLGSNTVNSSTIDSLKNEMFSVTVNSDTTAGRATLGSKKLKNSYNTALCNSSASVDELQNISANMWYTQSALSYPATLEVIGNTDLEPQSYCSVLAILLGGYPHHSSGVYLIQSIVDDIVGGTFTSRMSLIRNGLNIGTSENGGVVVTASTPPAIITASDGLLSESTSVDITGVGNSDIVRIACGEEGYVEGYNNDTKYGAWYGMNYNHWCAMFVSWCANQAGISTSIIPKYASCDTGMQWFISKGRFKYRGTYSPTQGDIVFFGTPDDSTHTGIVISSDGSKVYTIEGNTSDKVAKRSYSLIDSYIIGYGVPDYASNSIIEIDTSDATEGSGQKIT